MDFLKDALPPCRIICLFEVKEHCNDMPLQKESVSNRSVQGNQMVDCTSVLPKTALMISEKFVLTICSMTLHKQDVRAIGL